MSKPNRAAYLAAHRAWYLVQEAHFGTKREAEKERADWKARGAQIVRVTRYATGPRRAPFYRYAVREYQDRRETR